MIILLILMILYLMQSSDEDSVSAFQRTTEDRGLAGSGDVLYFFSCRSGTSSDGDKRMAFFLGP